MKTRIPLLIIVILATGLIASCETQLPRNISDLITERYNYTEVRINNFQKAPFPENYPGFAGNTAPVDEAWCVTVWVPQQGEKGIIAHRTGIYWPIVGPSYKITFEQLGCRNYPTN